MNTTLTPLRCVCGCGQKLITYSKSVISQWRLRTGRRKFNLGHNLTNYHGRSFKKEYNTWQSMKDRCFNQSVPEYKRYGGRGITVCDRWRYSFKNFFVDMGPRPDGTTIDRINNDGNYEPGNCRWATNQEQHNNTRSNWLITFQDKTKTVTQWARDLNMHPTTIISRIRQHNWSIEDALTRPPDLGARLGRPRMSVSSARSNVQKSLHPKGQCLNKICRHLWLLRKIKPKQCPRCGSVKIKFVSKGEE